MSRYLLNPLACLLLLAVAAPLAADPADSLAAGFADPPASARPRTWWHWLNGNITQDGIAKDLAWMRRAGLGGVQNFDADLFTPQIVPQRLVYMTPAWQDAFRFAVDTAMKEGLEFAVASSAGWSETGGSWVAPRDGLKKLVWSETTIEGGRRFKGVLAPPPLLTGPFQALPFHDPLAGPRPTDAPPPPTFYADTAVIAVPVTVATDPLPTLHSSGGRVLDSATLARADLGAAAEIEKGTPGEPGTLLASYPRPVTIATATLYLPNAVPMFGDPELLPALEVREGGGWRRLAELPLGDVPTTVSFAPVTASEFRLVLAPNTRPKRIGLGDGAPGAVVVDIFPHGPPARRPSRSASSA